MMQKMKEKKCSSLLLFRRRMTWKNKRGGEEVEKIPQFQDRKDRYKSYWISGRLCLPAPTSLLCQSRPASAWEFILLFFTVHQLRLPCLPTRYVTYIDQGTQISLLAIKSLN